MKMEDEKMSVEDMDQDVIRLTQKEDGQTNAGTDSAWMQRHLSDSIYLWAFGEKADDEDHAPTLSERFIAWLILFMQGFAYTTLIVLAKDIHGDGLAEDGGDTAHLLPSVAGAMYLLVASTTHDFQAGFSLLVDGLCAGQRLFGLGLLAVYGIMLSAAMTVIVSTSDNSETVVLNAVTVIFIADLDEKALKFFLTVPQKWRLFWAIESIGISFVLALIAIYHIGDSENIFGGHNEYLEEYDSWFFWMLNPGGVTVCCYCLSSFLQGVSESCSKAFAKVDELTIKCVVAGGSKGVSATIKRAKQCVREEPCFYSALVVWLVQGVVSWWFLIHEYGLPVALTIYEKLVDGQSNDLEISKEYISLVFSNAVLVAGLALKAMGAVSPRNHSICAVQEPRRSSDEVGARKGRGSCATDSRVSSLLVGWGTGYWVTSLLLVLGVSWHNGGWSGPPDAVRIIGYVFVPCFFVASAFMVADLNFLGTRLGALVKPAVEVMRDRRRVAYWAMVTVFRDALLAWFVICVVLIQTNVFVRMRLAGYVAAFFCL